MKIYILRHEDKTMDTSFFSPLTQEGIKNSIELIDILKEEDIDIVFSSPFIRTLQTVYPYCKKNSIKINIDYSISEIQNKNTILENSYTLQLPDYLKKKYKCSNYKSIILPNSYNYPEKIEDIDKRAKKFLHFLISNYNNYKNKNILIVSHIAICNVIGKIAYNKFTKSTEYTMDTKYPKGALTEIFNKGNWVFNPINWDPE
jgi:2,3-bisphosphoglycerate-dependent phosphoglycerate mutase